MSKPIEKWVTARKVHMCDDCRRYVIAKGDQYKRVKGIDGDHGPYTLKICKPCADVVERHRAEIAMQEEAKKCTSCTTESQCMRLPDGKTCRDCAHFKRCEWLLSREGDETECDWCPKRFREKVAA